MIKEIVKDREFLSKPAEEATAADTQVIEDLRDTLESLGWVAEGIAWYGVTPAEK